MWSGHLSLDISPVCAVQPHADIATVRVYRGRPSSYTRLKKLSKDCCRNCAAITSSVLWTTVFHLLYWCKSKETPLLCTRVNKSRPLLQWDAEEKHPGENGFQCLGSHLSPGVRPLPRPAEPCSVALNRDHARLHRNTTTARLEWAALGRKAYHICSLPCLALTVSIQPWRTRSRCYWAWEGLNPHPWHLFRQKHMLWLIFS